MRIIRRLSPGKSGHVRLSPPKSAYVRDFQTKPQLSWAGSCRLFAGQVQASAGKSCQVRANELWVAGAGGEEGQEGKGVREGEGE